MPEKNEANPPSPPVAGSLPVVGQTPLFVGMRYLLKKRLSYLAILGVALSVGTLIVVMSVMSGFGQHLESVIRGYNSDLTVLPVGAGLYGFTRDRWQNTARLARENPHVAATAPFVLGPALVRVLPGENMDHVFFRGIDPAAEEQVSDFGSVFLSTSADATKGADAAEAREARPGLHEALGRKYVDRDGAQVPCCLIGSVMAADSPALQTVEAFLRLAARDRASAVLSDLMQTEPSADVQDRLTEAFQALNTAFLTGGDVGKRLALERMHRAEAALSKAARAELRNATRIVKEGLPEQQRESLQRRLRDAVYAPSYAAASERLKQIVAAEAATYPRACAFLAANCDNVLDWAVVLVTATGDARRRIRKFHVADTFRTGRYDWDRQVVLLALDDATGFVASDGGVTGLSIRLTDFERAPEVVPALGAALGPGFRVLTWRQQESTFLEAVAMERFLMALILSFVGLLAGFCIFAILTMTVYEKRRDIGILKAVGLAPPAIANVFLFNGCAVGVMGAALGMAGGRLFAANINEIADFVERLTGWTPFPPTVYYFDTIPANLNWTTPCAIAAAAILCSLVFSVVPAWKAAKLDPVTTLRYE